jgi:hypothetical protein
MVECGKMFVAFFTLRKEILLFFKESIWDNNSRGSYKAWDSYVLSPFFPI